ncbi:MAG: HD domain-containing protein [Spirochaetes bacterium]|nr:MAG: HD domain-containing protein [Spirochaetota bacterium]
MKLDNNQQLEEIIHFSEELNTTQDLDLLLEKILLEARSFLNADAGSIQIKEGDELVFSHVQTDSMQRKLPPGQKLIYTTFRTRINKNSISGYAAITGEILNIMDAYKISGDSPYKFDPTNDKKSGYVTKSILTIPLKNNRNEILGVMQIINSLRTVEEGKGIDDGFEYVGSFDSRDEHLALHFASAASMILQRAQMTRDLILRMINMAELRDPKETGPHVNRVATLAIEIYERWAGRKNISPKEIDHNKDILRMSAMLHDVGKVGISDLILKKPGKLSPEEYEIMKSHTYIGAQLFKNKHSEFDEMATVVALNHHENWDGTGYPGYINLGTGLPEKTDGKGKPVPKKGEEIPIYGRIVALADVYDALSSRRVYKSAWTQDDVFNEIKILAGRKFDPELVEIFLENFDYFKSISSRYPDE